MTARWTMEGVCSGECCRLMTLSVEPEDVAVLAAGQRFAQRVWDAHVAAGGTAEDFVQPQVRRHPDAQFIEDNWVPVRRSYVHGTTGERLLPGFPTRPAPATQWRCTQWDGRRCKSYERRPGLCRRFGMEKGQECERAGCTFRPYPIFRDHDRWADDGGVCTEAEAA